MFVLNRSAGAGVLWALNDRRGDFRYPARGHRTPEAGGLTETVEEDSENARVNGQIVRSFAAL